MKRYRKREKLSNWLLKIAEYTCIALVINAFLPTSKLGIFHLIMGSLVAVGLVILALILTPEEYHG